MATARMNRLPQSTTVRTTAAARRPARLAAVRTHASLKDAGNWVSQAFLKIFTVADDKGVNWKGTETPFVGKISHKKKPFADVGSVNTSMRAETARSDPSAVNSVDVVEPNSKQQDVSGPASYIAGALERVIGHNFKGDNTEPDWKKAGSNGWTGDVHSRKSQGFHSKKQ